MALNRAPLRGRLESLNLSEIVQTITLGRKTGRLTLRSGRLKGRIWFEEGKARHAVAGKLLGEPAFITMVGWSSGRFVLNGAKRTEKKTLDQDAMVLVMEGLRRLDEASLGKSVNTTPQRRGHPLRLAIGIVILVLAVAVLLVVDVGRAGEILAGLRSDSRAAPAVAEPDTAVSIIGTPASSGSSVGSVAFGAPDWDALLWTAADVAGGEAVFVFDALNPELYSKEPEVVEVATIPETNVEPEVAEIAKVPEVVEPVSLELGSGAEGPFSMASLPAEEESFLAITGESRVKSGHLTILVNDEVVYDRQLSSHHKKAKRFFRKIAGKVDQTFEATIPMDGGTHEIVARLHVEGKPDHYENRLTVELEPGATRSLSLFAGRRSGRPLSLTLE